MSLRKRSIPKHPIDRAWKLGTKELSVSWWLDCDRSEFAKRAAARVAERQHDANVKQQRALYAQGSAVRK